MIKFTATLFAAAMLIATGCASSGMQKDAMMKDDGMMKKDTMMKDDGMMKKDAMMKDDMMKK
jgi:hypothetical protein